MALLYLLPLRLYLLALFQELEIYLGFITMPYNGGGSCKLYVSQDGGNSFNLVEVDYVELEDTQFKWTEIYDYYNMPTKENGKYHPLKMETIMNSEIFSLSFNSTNVLTYFH